MIYSIGDVARLAGLQPSAIRYYERVGLLAPARRFGGRRQYDESVVRSLALIGVAQAAGLTLAEIQALLHGFEAGTPAAERWRAFAKAKLDQVDELIARAHEMKRIIEDSLQCGCLTLEDCALSVQPAVTGCGPGIDGGIAPTARRLPPRESRSAAHGRTARSAR